MAEIQSKRQREETQEEDLEDPKRQKSYNHILSILEDEQEEPNQDVSSIFTSLQQELTCDCQFTTFDPSPLPTGSDGHQVNQITASIDYTPSPSPHVVMKEDENGRLFRHLLEASNDELGIPHSFDGGDDDEINGGDHGLCFGDGLWEIEDETASYYTLLQSQLFM